MIVQEPGATSPLLPPLESDQAWEERATWKVSTSEEWWRSLEDTAVSGDFSGKELGKGTLDPLISCRGSPPAKPYGGSEGQEGTVVKSMQVSLMGRGLTSGPGKANGTSEWQSQDLNMVLGDPYHWFFGGHIHSTNIYYPLWKAACAVLRMPR